MITDKSKRFFRVGAEDFKKIPGSPIAYWCSPATAAAFSSKSLAKCLDIRAGVLSGCDGIFIKNWFEVSYGSIPFTFLTDAEINTNNPSWLPLTGGGGYRKWYGALFSVIRSKDNFRAIKEKKGNNYRLREPSFYFKEGLNWPLISSRDFCAKLSPPHIIFGNSVRSGFLLAEERRPIDFFIGLLCSKIVGEMLKFINPTVNFNNEDLAMIPVCDLDNQEQIIRNTQRNITLSRQDWDAYETSWDFQSNPLLDANKRCNSPGKINTAYLQLREEWRMSCEEMRKLEVENNRIFIEAYGLQEELSPEVPWNEITLTCNPWYRYGKSPATTTVEGKEYFLSSEDCAVGDVTAIGEMGTAHVGFSDNHIPTRKFPFNQELEQRLLEDTVKEFISYAVGCMMGRYSPEKPGLILANQSSSLEEDQIHYETIVTGSDLFTVDPTFSISFTVQAGQSRLTSPLSSFYPEMGNGKHFVMDRNGILPILDDEWFMDDIVAQFKAFLTLTFGEEHFAQNLQFIEGALGKDIRKYFMKDFYKEHIQRYKKRPIYWLFSSPKGSFNALIYMHRYRPDTISIVLNDYLRDFITKLTARREHLIAENTRADLPRAARTRNLKLIDKYGSMLAELEAYERDILFPLAQTKIAIDLDDGVKVNYCKFGDALKPIPKLASEEN